MSARLGWVATLAAAHGDLTFGPRRARENLSDDCFRRFVMRATFPRSTRIACFEKIGRGHFIAVHGKVRPPFPSWEVENCLVMPNKYTEALAYDVDHTPYVRERANWVHASCKFAKIPPCAVCGAEKLPTVKFYKQSGTRNVLICGDCKRAGARA